MHEEYRLAFYIWLMLTWHFLADFLWQTHWQAVNKSIRNDALLRHVGTYTVGLAIFLASSGSPIRDPWCWAGFLISNAVLHFVIDYWTSRVMRSINNRIVGREDLLRRLIAKPIPGVYAYNVHEEIDKLRRRFFHMIGLDQFLHITCLIATFVIFWRPA